MCYSICLCLCLFACVCVWRSCVILQLFFTLVFETNSLTAPGNQWLVRQVGQWVPQICLSGFTSPHSCAQQWNCMYILLWLVFKLVLDIWTPIPMFTWQGIIPRIENFMCSISHEVLTKKKWKKKNRTENYEICCYFVIRKLGMLQPRNLIKS